ncbi:MAG: metal ABC transporter solute-binding protein, Zn/Mn family [Candidatus Reddybacter sp.]
MKRPHQHSTTKYRRNSLALGLLFLLTLSAQALMTPSVLAADNVPKSNKTSSEASSQKITIITSLPITYYLGNALTANTNIEVKNLPKRGRRLNGQANFFTSRAEKLATTFKSASAVITIGKLWRDDPLFTAARSANIRIVEIDATKPWSSTLEGISVAMTPAQDSPWTTDSHKSGHGAEAAEIKPSVFFWLSLANSARSAEIIAQDLMRLVPAEADTIKSNLVGVRSKLMELQRSNELALLNASDITVFSLAPELIYLTSEQSLFVDGSFYKQDIEWASEDTAALEKHLKQNEIGVVLHKWKPAEPILNAIKAAGAKLVVIETLDVGIAKKGRMLPESYFMLMEKNLGSLRAALVE